jgi:hypothetical protein
MKRENMKTSLKSLLWLMLSLLILPTSLAAQDANSLQTAAFNWDNGRLYFFSGEIYSRYNWSNDRVDSGYPKATNTRTWPGLSFQSIDAAVNYGDNVAYFFSGDQFVKYNLRTDSQFSGYPRNTARDWGLPFSQVDAAFSDRGSYLYFFHGSQYSLYNTSTQQIEQGYPKPIASLNLPQGFSRIEAAVYANNKAYLFSGSNYLRVSLPNLRVDSGYPLAIAQHWPGLNFYQDRRPMPPDPPKPTPTPPGPTRSENVFPPEPSDVSGMTGFRVEEFTVDLSPKPIRMENTVLGWVRPAYREDGWLYAVYQNGDDVIIQTLDSSLAVRGNPIVLRDYWFSDIRVDEDHNMTFLLGRDDNNTYISGYPNSLYILKIDPSGRQLFRTHIFGGDGHGPGQSWFDGRSQAELTWNGQNYGVYFEVQKNWADPGETQDVHNGDMFIEVTPQGQLREDTEHFWTASHSSTIQTAAASTGEFFTMTIGDAYPYGLQLYNRDQDKNWVLWPPVEDHLTYEEVNSTNAAGILEEMLPVDNGFVAFLGTLDSPNIGIFDKVDVLFLKTDLDGNLQEKKWLIESPNLSESVISAIPMGGEFLVAWGEGNDYDDNWRPGQITLALIDQKGSFILPPNTLDFPLGTYSKLEKGPGNTAVYTLADNGSSSFKIYKITLE